ncbi:putative N-formylglutamate aminohydrolase [Rhodococcus wratislaviensis]|uniref:Putative N-formylglutamate aminohydrolase n=1 Tax=Rhodococcus wratislaviensis TaxID=44752 RepID=A0A402CGC9_RHOWR|nr:N-formylglutamate amidohydrolase [Rhodococcus wratislaviensis]GCE42609.1 putative N-formylglutamate aminohydrolase [Rhodococcus wratislaviensis]
MTPYRIQAGHADSPVILHVPHASRSIPENVRAGILLTDDQLQRELDESTDTATDHIALRTTELLAAGLPQPWLAINQFSRLVIDPERFPGDDEPMNAVGRGAVYTRTCNRALLRPEPAPDTQHLMDTYYHPYATALTDLVDDRIATTGTAVIIDLHSYPHHPSRFEDPNKPRPALCLGTDDFHTPNRLREQARDAFAPIGDIATNTPYGGCYVPLNRYQQDPRVSAVMIELRRDQYLTTPSAANPNKVDTLAGMLATLVAHCTPKAAAD